MIDTTRSVESHPEGLDHRRPEDNIGFEATAEFLGRRIEAGLETRIDQLLLVGAIRKRRAHRLCNLLDDRLRRAGGSDGPDRLYVGEAGEARLRHRRKLRRRDEALRA